MRWPWAHIRELSARLLKESSVLAEVQHDRGRLIEERTVLYARISDLKEYHLREIELLKADGAYWKHLSENLLDRKSVAEGGLPIFHKANLPPELQEPEPTEPSPDALRAQDEAEISEGIPRSALLRNPRRHAVHTTMQQTVAHNQRQVREGIRDVQDFINSEGRKRAEQIEQPTKVG